jgi:MYXO-CTERM domain-containing protein
VNVVNDGELLSHGSSVAIQGTELGSKARPAPLVWQSFDDGVAGASLSSTGFWSVSSDNPEATAPKFDSQHLRNDRGLNALFTYPPIAPDSYQRDIIYRQGLGIGPGDKVFLSVWIRSTYPGPDQPSSKQWKILRLSDGPYNSDTYPDLILTWNRNGFYSVYRDGAGAFISSCTGESQAAYMAAPAADEWFSFMVEATVESAVGACDGEARTWYDGRRAMDASRLQALFDASDSGWDELWLGEYIQDNTVGYTARFDDVYVDDSWARVEIGDAPTYEDCSHREVQVPTDWQSTQVTVQVNQGALSAGDEHYLYVVDDEGQPSPGFPIRFDEESGPSDAGAEAPDAQAPPDGGALATGPATGDGSGCACSAASRRTSPPRPLLFLVASLLALFPRRRLAGTVCTYGRPDAGCEPS